MRAIAWTPADSQSSWWPTCVYSGRILRYDSSPPHTFYSNGICRKTWKCQVWASQAPSNSWSFSTSSQRRGSCQKVIRYLNLQRSLCCQYRVESKSDYQHCSHYLSRWRSSQNTVYDSYRCEHQDQNCLIRMTQDKCDDFLRARITSDLYPKIVDFEFGWFLLI